MIANNHQYNEIKNALLGVRNILAPTNAVQRRLVNLVHDIEDANEVPQEVVRGALLDGVTHGNWPQTKGEGK